MSDDAEEGAKVYRAAVAFAESTRLLVARGLRTPEELAAAERDLLAAKAGLHASWSLDRLRSQARVDPSAIQPYLDALEAAGDLRELSRELDKAIADRQADVRKGRRPVDAALRSLVEKHAEVLERLERRESA